MTAADTPTWIIPALYLITLLNVLVSAGYAIAGVVQARTAPDGMAGGNARVFALYAAARALPLALVAVVAMIWGTAVTVAWLGLLAGIVQLLDAGIGRVQRDLAKTLGPLAIAILQFAVLIAFLA